MTEDRISEGFLISEPFEDSLAGGDVIAYDCRDAACDFRLMTLGEEDGRRTAENEVILLAHLKEHDQENEVKPVIDHDAINNRIASIDRRIMAIEAETVGLRAEREYLVSIIRKTSFKFNPVRHNHAVNMPCFKGKCPAWKGEEKLETGRNRQPYQG